MDCRCNHRTGNRCLCPRLWKWNVSVPECLIQSNYDFPEYRQDVRWAKQWHSTNQLCHVRGKCDSAMGLSSFCRGDDGGRKVIKRCALTAILTLVSVMGYGQQLDDVSRWATIAASEYVVYPNITYSKAGGYDLKLDVVTAGSPSSLRPTLIYIHGGGWVL